MDLGSAIFAVAAGTLSILSPCVLPLLPALLMGASAEHRLGPAAMAGGLAVSFTGIGIFVATVGYTLGLSGDVFRMAGGLLLVLVGVVLLLPAAQERWAIAAGPVQNFAQARFGMISTSGLRGQFALGLLLGAVWAPCVGPTLGAASLMASRGENLLLVAVTMLLFAVGAALPLLALGLVSRQAWSRWSKLAAVGGKVGKVILGAILIVVGVLVLTGADKAIEAFLVAVSPAWLTALTTSI